MFVQKKCPSICPSIHPQTLSGLKSALSDSRTERGDIRPKRADFRPERTDFRPERANSKPEKADFRLKRADFEPEKSDGGGTNGMTNESPPVFYKTSSPLRPLPKNQLKNASPITKKAIKLKD